MTALAAFGLLSACSRHDLAYCKAHPDQVQSAIDRCLENGGGHKGTPECRAAAQAYYDSVGMPARDGAPTYVKRENDAHRR